MPARIVLPPLLVPGDKGQAARWIVVADSRGAIKLVRTGDFAVEREWSLGGPITAGPFWRGDRVGCVVEYRRLVWLDPQSNKPVWTYTSSAGKIVGRPQLSNGAVLVAHLGGRIVALNPADGRVQGKGYQLQGSIAPAGSPAALGGDNVFLPLTDGTALLLSHADLR
jgi:hypothetical protein